jgi:hypothetical protein
LRNAHRRTGREIARQLLHNASAAAALKAGFERLEPRVLLAGQLVDDGHDHDHEPLVDAYVPPASFVYNPGGTLTGASRGRPLDIALNFLRNSAQQFGLDRADLEAPIVSSQYTGDNGITYIYLTQEFNGLAVANSVMNVAVLPNGSILSVGGGFVPGLGEAEQNAPAPIPQIRSTRARR